MYRRLIAPLLAIALIILPGCYSKKEPKDLAIMISVLYDKGENGLYSCSAEFMKLSGGTKGAGGQISNMIDTDEAASPREAFTDMAHYIEHSLYSGHNQVRFFSERYAQSESDMGMALDFTMRDHLTDETAYVIVVKGPDPIKIYSASLGQSATLGLFVSDHEKNQLVSGSKAVFKTSLEFIKGFYTEGKEPVAGVIELQEYVDPSAESSTKSSSESGSSSKSSLKLNMEGLAVFKGLQLVGYLNGQGTRAYNFITNNIKTSIITVPFDNSDTVLEIISSGCQAKINLESNAAKIDMKFKIDMRVLTHGGKSDIYEKDVKDQVEQEFNKQMEAEFLTAIQQVQGYQSDIFGFGQQLHIQDPKAWKTVKDQWNDIFSQAEVKVSVDSTISTVGQLKDSVLSESEK